MSDAGRMPLAMFGVKEQSNLRSLLVVRSALATVRLQSRIAAAIRQVVGENLLYENPPSRRQPDHPREQWTTEFRHSPDAR